MMTMRAFWATLLSALVFAGIAALSCSPRFDARAGTMARADTDTREAREPAGPRQVAILRQWKGRRPLGTAPLNPPYVTDAAALARLWDDWKVPEPLPRVDFDREIVLTMIVRSGLVRFMGPTLDADGNLQRNGVATPDYPAHWSYVIAVVSRDGVKSIDGQKL